MNLVSQERTPQRDFQQRLIHLGIEYSAGAYRLARRPLRPHSPDTFTFINNTGISGIIPTQNRKLIRLLTSTSGISPCLIGHGGLPSAVTQSAPFLPLAQKPFAITVPSRCRLTDAARRNRGTTPSDLPEQTGFWSPHAPEHSRFQDGRDQRSHGPGNLFRNKPEFEL